MKRGLLSVILDSYIEAWIRSSDFSGTTSRKNFYYFSHIHLAISILLALIDHMIIKSLGIVDFALLVTIYSIGSILPNLSIMARRMRDTGQSQLSFLWALIPFAGLIIVLVMLSRNKKD